MSNSRILGEKKLENRTTYRKILDRKILHFGGKKKKASTYAFFALIQSCLYVSYSLQIECKLIYFIYWLLNDWSRWGIPGIEQTKC